MKKVLALSVLSFILMFNTTLLKTFAESPTKETNVSSQEENQKTLEELYEYADQTNNFEIVSASELPENTPTINFDSVEDFKRAIEESREIQANNEEIETFYEKSDVSTNAPKLLTRAAATKNDSKRISWSLVGTWEWIYQWWLPPNMWIDFTYTYTGSGSSKKFSKITKITSNSSGFPSSWVETTSVSNFYDDNKGVSIKIQGYHLLGVSIGGQAIGTKFYDNYTKKYHF
ncbi:hypothetical protein [Niallia sp. 03190]|uniref:hypothetical protein n=1 Tax=Niallia sp. 03190 TaxID=3458061 RepID=UPI004043DAAD